MLRKSTLLVATSLSLAACQGSDGPIGPAGSGIPSYTAIFQYQVSPSATYSNVNTTFVAASDPTTSFSSNPALVVRSGPTSADWVRSLLWFDISSLPSNAEVQGAYVSIFYSGDQIFSADTVSVGLHEVLCPWDLTATWNVSATSVPWGACRSGNTSPITKGQQFAAAPMDTVRFHTFSDDLRFIAWNVAPSVVQGWVDDRFANWGVALVSEREGTESTYSLNFSGRQGADMGPSLVVTYTVP